MVDNKWLPVCWIGTAGLILAIDYVSGPMVRFPILFVLPVALSTWYSGWRWGLGFSLALPIVRCVFATTWNVPCVPSWTEAVINGAIQASAMAIVVWFVHKIKRQSAEIRILHGLIPICSFCKRIRNDKQEWEQLESYISSRSEAMFSHGLCPDCTKKHYGQYLKK